MKKLALFFVFIVTVPIIYSCGDKKEIKEHLQYRYSQQRQKDWENYMKMARVKGDMAMLAFYFYTDGFEKGVGEQTEEFYKENEAFLWKAYASIISDLTEHEEEYTASIERLQKYEFESFLSVNKDNTLEIRKVEDYTNGKMTAQNTWGWNPLVTPAYAVTQPAIVLPLVVNSSLSFANVGKKCGRTNRQAVMYIAKTMSKKDLKSLFDNLPADEKAGEKDYIAWWKNFENGKYDNKAFSVMCSFAYKNTDEANLNFNVQAQEMGLLASQQFRENIKEVGSAGAQLALDLNLKYLDMICPGISKGVDIANYAATALNIRDTLNKSVQNPEFWKKQNLLYYATHPDELPVSISDDDRTFVMTEIQKKFIEKILEDKKIVLDSKGQKYLEMKNLDSGEILEGMLYITNQILDKVVDDTTRPRIDWADEDREHVTVVIHDMDDETPAKVYYACCSRCQRWYKLRPNSSGEASFVDYCASVYSIKGVDALGNEDRTCVWADELGVTITAEVYTYDKIPELLDEETQAEIAAAQKELAEAEVKAAQNNTQSEAGDTPSVGGQSDATKAEAEQAKPEPAQEYTDPLAGPAATATDNSTESPQKNNTSTSTPKSDESVISETTEVEHPTEVMTSPKENGSWMESVKDFITKPIQMATGSGNGDKGKTDKADTKDGDSSVASGNVGKEDSGFKKVWKEFLDFFRNLLRSIFGGNDDKTAATEDAVSEPAPESAPAPAPEVEPAPTPDPEPAITPTPVEEPKKEAKEDSKKADAKEKSKKDSKKSDSSKKSKKESSKSSERTYRHGYWNQATGEAKMWTTKKPAKKK